MFIKSYVLSRNFFLVLAFSLAGMVSACANETLNQKAAPKTVMMPMPMKEPLSIQTQGQATTVSAKFENSSFNVSISLNGGVPLWVVVDTGMMGALSLKPAVAERLGLKVMDRMMIGDPSGQNAKEMNIYSVDSLTLGDIKFARLQAVELPDMGPRMADLDGVICIAYRCGDGASAKKHA